MPSSRITAPTVIRISRRAPANSRKASGSSTSTAESTLVRAFGVP
ncbi:MAG TPA: hypothetical protein VFB06_02010 [Streptosporangiaceae bacterium]|nr:hypothetical protein [Streptosporangiaceae bacterium]